jgi:hypothetical protein
MKWNMDKLVECYYGGEADELFTKGGIADPRAANSAMVRSEWRLITDDLVWLCKFVRHGANVQFTSDTENEKDQQGRNRRVYYLLG